MQTRKIALLSVALAVIVLSACASQPAAQPPAEVTRIVEVTRAVEVTRPVEVTRIVEVEVTRIVEQPPVVVTATPEPEPTAAPAVEAPRVIDDVDQTQDRGGVTITVKGAGLTDWAAVKDTPDLAIMSNTDGMKDATVLGAITVVVTNTTPSKINVHPGQGTVVIGSEQIELTGFMFFGDNVGGTLLPGVTKDGTLLFALSRTPWADIANGAKIIYEIGAPSDESFAFLAKEPYRFEFNAAPAP